MAKKTGVELALAKFGGSPAKLAAAIGGTVLRQHVEHWRKTGSIPAAHCPRIEEITGVPCEKLRPGPAWGVLRQAATDSAI